MISFKRWNNVAGWFAFLIAAVVYLLTIEPTASFWDCGEFIASAFKLEVGHPPGAPLFLMLAKVFSLIAPDKTKVALMINAMSALASAFTILFLFWSITHLARKITIRDNNYGKGKILAVLGAGLVGALAYTFSDTFWFSAVESEVYGTSSLFTAIVFWAILKWEEADNVPYTNRWLILIAYLMGLSIGIHLLNLLTIPAIVLVYYFKKYQPTIVGFIIAVMVSFILLAGVQYMIIPGIVKLAALSELLFVNSYGLPYNSGIIFYSTVLFSLLLGGIWFTYKKRKILTNTILLAIAMIILGYGSYAMIVIRSSANTPLDEGNPDNVFSLLSYLNREQYGDRPLLFGQYYNAPIIHTKQGKPSYIKENGKYIISDRDSKSVYDSRFTTIFPRMYSRNSEHIDVYKQWANIKGKTITVNRNDKRVVEYCPTFEENLSFFLKYQLGYMYFRYFLWNFAGRQNELEGDGGILCGNWLSGIKWIDNFFFGPQDKLPTYMKDNKGRNKYFCLPLILGLIGMFYQLVRHKRDFTVVLFLFFMTGIAIVIYLNQTPLQPRERDYAYAGSFYAFAIWIGLGVLALVELLKKWFSTTTAAITASVVALLAVPTIMAAENWDDHNRSGRYTTRDVAYDYLNSCAPNAILFTNGDNDTFPLWYLQEVEGIRTDVRVVNLTLLNADWYIDQLKRQAYESVPLPISLTYNKYRQGKRDVVYFIEKTQDYMDLKEAISFVRSDDPKTKIIAKPDIVIDYFRSRNFVLPVDTLNVASNGTVRPELSRQIVPHIELNFNSKKWYITKSELMVMDILANNNWERPIYYTSPSHEGTLGLDNYLQLEGFAFRLVPIQTKKTGYFSIGRIETSVMYNNLMNKFLWGRMNMPNVLMDSNNIFTFSVLRMRVNFARLAEQLFEEGKKDSALKVIDRCLELMPAKTFPPNVYSFRLAEAAYKVGAYKRANQIVDEYTNKCFEELIFFYAMPKRLCRFIENECDVTEQTIEHLGEIALKNGNKQMLEKLKKRMKEITGKNMQKAIH
jgi:hypothetical protein